MTQNILLFLNKNKKIHNISYLIIELYIFHLFGNTWRKSLLQYCYSKQHKWNDLILQHYYVQSFVLFTRFSLVSCISKHLIECIAIDGREDLKQDGETALSTTWVLRGQE